MFQWSVVDGAGEEVAAAAGETAGQEESERRLMEEDEDEEEGVPKTTGLHRLWQRQMQMRKMNSSQLLQSTTVPTSKHNQLQYNYDSSQSTCLSRYALCNAAAASGDDDDDDDDEDNNDDDNCEDDDHEDDEDGAAKGYRDRSMKLLGI